MDAFGLGPEPLIVPHVVKNRKSAPETEAINADEIDGALPTDGKGVSTAHNRREGKCDQLIDGKCVNLYRGLESELLTPPWMKYLRPSMGTAIGKALAGLWLAGFSSILAWCAVTSPAPSRVIPHPIPLTQLERTLRRVPAHISEFSPVSPPLAVPKCGNVRPPEALLTPDPLLPVQDNLHVRVSFIVGSDGHVHSAFILDSGGDDEDQIVLHAVRFWRYRPALCNGVPTDSEALVRFSIR